MSDLTYEYPAEVVMQRARETRAMIEENERLRFRVLQLENEIVTNLQGDLAILAESYHLTEDALRAEAFSRYEAAVQRWRNLDQDAAAPAAAPGGRDERCYR